MLCVVSLSHYCFGSETSHTQCRIHTHFTGADGQAPPRPPQANTIQTIVPLFKLTKGVASSSDGFSCAVLAGLATPVVQRAE